MRPAPTPLQEELRSAVRTFCEREVTPGRLRAWESSPDGADATVLGAAAELGWLGLGAPVDLGGSGAPLVDVAFLLSQCARGLLPRSLIGAVRGVVALVAVAPSHPVVAELVAGRRRLALAVDEESARRADGFATRIDARGSRAVVCGAKAYVCDAQAFDLHLVAAREGAHASLVLVDARGPGVRIEPLQTFGGDRQAHVYYDEAPVLESLASGAAGLPALAKLQRVEQALALAEMVGGMEAVLEASVAYVKEREQFGQKIGLFQAVRHQIADMGTRLTAARHLAWRAITRVSAGREQGLELETALVYVSQAFKELCFTGHHVHGGAGFVVEHPMHLHSERAQSLAIRWAPEGPALEHIAGALLDGTP